MMRRAVVQLKSGRLGPVLLEMHREAMAAEYPDEEIAYTPVQVRRSTAASEDVRDMVTDLLKAQRPVIIAGQGVLYAEATEELIAFAELARVPVMTTLAGKSAFPETHPLSLGTGGHTYTLMVKRFLASMDFGLGIGTSFTRNTFTTPMPEGVPLGQVTNCAEDMGKDFEVAVGALGGCETGVAADD